MSSLGRATHRRMADDRPEPRLYETDFYAWTQAQAAALRVGAGAELDYERLAEEVGDLGSSEWNAVWTLLVRIVEHLHKLSSSPAVQPRNKWRAEVRQFRLEMRRKMTRSIRNGMELELDAVHMAGAELAQAAMDDHGDGVHIDAGVRWSLAELLGEHDDPLGRP